MTQRRAEAQAELLDRAVELLGQDGRRGTIPISGRSMRPTLAEGQRVAVEFRPQALRPGDVLLMLLEDEGLVLHRLMGRSGRGLRTRGDGTILFDPPIDPQQVKGRVIAVRHRDGWRDLRGAPARIYGRCFAVHGLFWGGVGAVLARIHPRLRHGIGFLDQGLLQLAHLLLFRLLHRRTVLD